MPSVLMSKLVPLGPDVRLRVQAIADPAGARIDFRILRASPADRSTDRFRETGEGFRVPASALKRIRAELETVGSAALEFEFWRPLSTDRPAA